MRDPEAPPHIQRCTYQETSGGLGSVVWQCRLTDPHPDQDHKLPIDAEFGRDLDVQDSLWLAAKLRDQVAKTRHTQRRLDDVRAAHEWACDCTTEDPCRVQIALDGPRG